MLEQVADRKAVEQLLAARLVRDGKLDEPVLDRVLRIQADNDERLESLLVKLGFASERDVAEALAAQLDLPIVHPHDFPDTPVLEDRVSKLFLLQAAILPLADAAEHVVL